MSADHSKSYKIETRFGYLDGTTAGTGSIDVSVNLIDADIDQTTLDTEIPGWDKVVSKGVWNELRKQQRLSQFDYQLHVKTAAGSGLRFDAEVKATTSLSMFRSFGEPSLPGPDHAYNVTVTRK